MGRAWSKKICYPAARLSLRRRDNRARFKTRQTRQEQPTPQGPKNKKWKTWRKLWSPPALTLSFAFYRSTCLCRVIIIYHFSTLWCFKMHSKSISFGSLDCAFHFFLFHVFVRSFASFHASFNQQFFSPFLLPQPPPPPPLFVAQFIFFCATCRHMFPTNATTFSHISEALSVVAFSYQKKKAKIGNKIWKKKLYKNVQIKRRKSAVNNWIVFSFFFNLHFKFKVRVNLVGPKSTSY